jgi:hypothetical protein
MHGEHYGPVGFQFGRDLLKIAAMQQKRVLGNCIRGLTQSGLLRNLCLMGVDQVATAFIGLLLSEIDLALIGNPDLEELVAEEGDEPVFSEWLRKHTEYEDLTFLTINAYGDDFEEMQVYIGYDLAAGTLNYGEFVDEWPSDWRRKFDKLETLFERRPGIFLANCML